MGSRDGSHKCVPGSIPGPGVICGLSLLLVLYSAPRGFSLGTPVFPFRQKPAFPDSTEFDPEMYGHFWTSSCELLGAPWVEKLHIYITYVYIHLFLQLLTIFTKFNARLAELFDYLYLTYSKEYSHEDQWNNQNGSNKHPQEEHEIMPTEELPR